MKLYEILNEKYLGRKFKLIKDGIEGEQIREIAMNGNDKYGYVMNNIWNLSEGNLLEEVKLVETDEDRFIRTIKDNDFKINKKDMGNITVASNYYNLKSFKEQEDVLYIELNNYLNTAHIQLNFEEFDRLVKYVETLRRFKTK